MTGITLNHGDRLAIEQAIRTLAAINSKAPAPDVRDCIAEAIDALEEALAEDDNERRISARASDDASKISPP